MKSLFTAASIIALLAGAPAWAHSSHQANSQKSANSQKQTKSHQALNTQDKSFIHQAADGNLLQVDLGRIAMQKSTQPAIQEFGRWMVASHNYANTRLSDITKEVGAGNLFQPKLTLPNQQVKQELGMLNGAQFDRQYTSMMVSDQRGVIPQFRQEAQYGKNQKLKTYAHNLLPVLNSQLAEVEHLSVTSPVATGMGAPPAVSGSSGSTFGR